VISKFESEMESPDENESETGETSDPAGGDNRPTSTTRTVQGKRTPTGACASHTVDDTFTWTSTIGSAQNTTFTESSGFRNLPDNLGPDSPMTDFLQLFLDTSIMQLMIDCTNKRATQTKQRNPKDYCASSWVDVTVHEMRALIGMRLSMEHLIIKPRYAVSSSSSVTATLGYRSVFTRDRFLAIWKFCHVMDEEDSAVNKSDKIYKVCPLI